MAELLRAYRRTRFTAWIPERIDIRVDQTCQPLDAMLTRLDESSWAYITAYNPGSRVTDEAENRNQQARLRQELAERWTHVFDGEGVGEDGEWPPEPSLLIVGISEAEAMRIGRDYGQIAIVTGRVGEPAHLTLCDDRR